MCGIAALIAPHLERADVLHVRRMVAQMQHRGSDDEGYCLAGASGARSFAGPGSSVSLPPIAAATPDSGDRVILGHRRLAIVDLSADGHQPFIDPATGSALSFAGEIYNHQELRVALAAAGVVCRTATDTEVILRAWQAWGPACLERFEGMWAFVLWDATTGRAFFARDRMGEKQLYYASLPGGRVVAASEVRPILAAGVDRAPDPAMMFDFLALGIADHTGGTAFRDVQQVEPGCYAEVTPGTLPVIHRWYTVPRSPFGGHPEDVRTALMTSVRERLRGDVPVAAFLSAGMDSSSVVACAGRLLDESKDAGRATQELRAYTRVYASTPMEEQGARAVAALTPRTRLAELVGREEELLRDIGALVTTQELPFHTSAIHAGYSLMRTVREETDVKVVLTGDGGDEIFGGYVRVYAPFALWDAVRRGALSDRAGALAALVAAGPKQAPAVIAKAALHHAPPTLRRALLRRMLTGPSVLASAFARAYGHRLTMLDAARSQASLSDRLYGDATKWNLPQLLRHLDRNAMAFGIEARAPFLGRAVVETAFAGSHTDIEGLTGKQRLRQAMRPWLPAQVVDRAAKTGFGAMEQFWFEPLIRELRTIPALGEFVDLEVLERLATRRREARFQELWLAVSAGLWLDQFGTGGRWQPVPVPGGEPA